MKINVYLMLAALCASNHLHASQASQKEHAQEQKQATKLELQMIEEARTNRLTKKKLQNYLKLGADLNAKDNNGSTPLIWATIEEHTDLAKLLIAKGADVNAKNNNSNTPLIWAALNNDTDVVQLLIAKGADVNAKSNNGDTPLLRAAINDNSDLAQLLIAAGADAAIVNRRDGNKTARDYARDKGAYDKAVAAGLKLKEQREYLARQTKANKKIAATVFAEEFEEPSITELITDYAYGQSPHDLPETKAELEQKECAAEKK